MENDPLQQLRDVHLPPDPSWWPPAVGWWILLALVVASIAWIIYTIIQRYQSRAPIRAAQSTLLQMYNGFQSGAISANDYLHQGNELLKRLLVRAYGRYEYASMSGRKWLLTLDQLSATDAFSAGPGQALGEARFSVDPSVDVEGLHAALLTLLKKVKP